jgi:hypothetical protein
MARPRKGTGVAKFNVDLKPPTARPSAPKSKKPAAKELNTHTDTPYTFEFTVTLDPPTVLPSPRTERPLEKARKGHAKDHATKESCPPAKLEKRHAGDDGAMPPRAKRAKEDSTKGCKPAEKYSPAVEAQRLRLESTCIPDSVLHMTSMSKVTKTLLGCQIRRPRFLFRSFGSESGGGVDPRLNSEDGIVPHGFLDGKKPTGMFDNPNLRGMIDCHLEGDSCIQSDFSSWAANIATSLSFTVGKRTAYLAVLDTEAMESHVEVHHVPDLFAVGIAYTSFTEEYLVYGPVRGRAFHCVSVAKLSNYMGDLGVGYLPYGLHTTNKLPAASLPSKNMFSVARNIGKLYRRDGIESEEMVIAVTAAFLGLHFSSTNRYAVSSEAKTATIKELAPELSALGHHPPAQLVNTSVDTYRNAGFEMMVDLLVALQRVVDEARVKKLGRKIKKLRLPSDAAKGKRPGAS